VYARPRLFVVLRLANAPGVVNQVWIVSELQALREVIFMLLGHPCVLLKKGHEDDECIVRIDTEIFEKRFALRHASVKGFEAVLEWFAVQGTTLNRIRKFTRSKEDSPEQQSLIAAVEEKIIALDQKLIAIEEMHVGKGQSIDVLPVARLSADITFSQVNRKSSLYLPFSLGSNH